MGDFLPNTPAERQMMLEAIGLPDMEALYADVPAEARLKTLDLPEGESEMEALRDMRGLARANTVYPTVLRGAGAYRHYIPAVVKSVATNETFLTAYTPYQAEMSQGILQSIFEFQTMICRLTGLDAANASVYDGATAAAEAMAMCRDRKRPRAFAAASADPMVLSVMRTYGTVELIPEREGRLDLEALKGALGADAACLYLQQPNYLGLLEDVRAAEKIVHAAGAKLVLGVNPLYCALYQSPGELGADIAVGEGQPLGLPLSFGGPYLGFMAARQELLRKLPGRIVGETTDKEGRRAFVLTLQAREQHIRREKAASNICSNEALCALTAAAYMAAMGTAGMREAARQCHDKAVYLARALCQIPGVSLPCAGEFFHEFVTALPVDAQTVLEALSREGILGGLPVAGGLLWCATEVVTKSELDRAAAIVREACL